MALPEKKIFIGVNFGPSSIFNHILSVHDISHINEHSSAAAILWNMTYRNRISLHTKEHVDIMCNKEDNKCQEKIMYLLTPDVYSVGNRQIAAEWELDLCHLLCHVPVKNS